MAAAVARERKRRKEVQVVRQWEARSMLSLPGELALTTPARWELKWRQSLFLYCPLIFFYSLHLLPPSKAAEGRYLQRGSSTIIKLRQRLWFRWCTAPLWDMLLCSLQTRCSLQLNRNHPGRWLIIQTPAPHSQRFWFCRAGIWPKTLCFVLFLTRSLNDRDEQQVSPCSPGCSKPSSRTGINSIYHLGAC